MDPSAPETSSASSDVNTEGVDKPSQMDQKLAPKSTKGESLGTGRETSTAKSDEWSDVKDPGERRKIQNKLAQRRFRDKATAKEWHDTEVLFELGPAARAQRRAEIVNAEKERERAKVREDDLHRTAARAQEIAKRADAEEEREWAARRETARRRSQKEREKDDHDLTKTANPSRSFPPNVSTPFPFAGTRSFPSHALNPFEYPASDTFAYATSSHLEPQDPGQHTSRPPNPSTPNHRNPSTPYGSNPFERRDSNPFASYSTPRAKRAPQSWAYSSQDAPESFVANQLAQLSAGRSQTDASYEKLYTDQNRGSETPPGPLASEALSHPVTSFGNPMPTSTQKSAAVRQVYSPKQDVTAQDEDGLWPWYQPRPVMEEDPAAPDDTAFAHSPRSYDMLKYLASVESRMFPKTELIAQWQESADVNQNAPKGFKIRGIYRACIGFYSLLLPLIVDSREFGNEDKGALRRDYYLLQDWGASYRVKEGRLDLLADEASEVTDTVVIFLVEIASILAQRIPTLVETGQVEDPGLLLRGQEQLQSMIRELQGKDTDESEGNTADEPLANDTFQQCVSDLHDYVQLLSELHPSIEPYLHITEDQPEKTEEEGMENRAFMFYADMVRQKFSDAPTTLVDILGKLNLERFTRMAATREHNFGTTQAPNDVSVGPTSTYFHDSGLGSSLPSYLLPTRGAPSLAFTLAGTSRSKLPPLPIGAKRHPIQCDYCGKTVTILTQKEWEKHILKDLQPYSCLDVSCAKSSEVFASRNDWIQHLQSEHNLKVDSPSRQCELCQSQTGSGMIEICKHFAAHLEDIAIAALGHNITSEDGSDADSTKSHGDVPAEATALGIEVEECKTQTGLQLDNLLDYLPNCAICNGPANPECPCEAERLQIAVQQAEHRRFSKRLDELRISAINSSRQHVLNAFEKTTLSRKQEHSTHLASLPHYQVYMQYSGHPPIHPTRIEELQTQIAEAHADLRRQIDEARRAAVLRYPEVLDYFYSLVEVHKPSNRDPKVTSPDFGYLASKLEPEKSSLEGTHDPATCPTGRISDYPDHGTNPSRNSLKEWARISTKTMDDIEKASKWF